MIGSCPNRYAWSASIKRSQQGKSMTFHSSGIRVQDRIYQGYLYPYNPKIQYQINYLVQHVLSWVRLEVSKPIDLPCESSSEEEVAPCESSSEEEVALFCFWYRFLITAIAFEVFFFLRIVISANSAIKIILNIFWIIIWGGGSPVLFLGSFLYDGRCIWGFLFKDEVAVVVFLIKYPGVCFQHKFPASFTPCFCPQFTAQMWWTKFLHLPPGFWHFFNARFSCPGRGPTHSSHSQSQTLPEWKSMSESSLPDLESMSESSLEDVLLSSEDFMLDDELDGVSLAEPWPIKPILVFLISIHSTLSPIRCWSLVFALALSIRRSLPQRPLPELVIFNIRKPQQINVELISKCCDVPSSMTHRDNIKLNADQAKSYLIAKLQK